MLKALRKTLLYFLVLSVFLNSVSAIALNSFENSASSKEALKETTETITDSQEIQGRLEKWARKKAPFTLRKLLDERNELSSKDEKTVLSKNISIDWTTGEILVSIQKGYSLIHPIWTIDDFPEIEIESLKDLTEGAADVRQKLGIENPHQPILLLTLKEKTREGLLQACEELIKRKEVQAVEPNYIISTYLGQEEASFLQTLSTDQKRLSQNEVAFETMNVAEAWTLTKGERVRVAVIDSGVANHCDLISKLSNGIDAVTPSSGTADDPSGHGTFIAGIIAAEESGELSENEYRMNGVAPAAEIVPVQVFTSYFVTDDGEFVLLSRPSDYATAINYLIQQNVFIANCSVGFSITDEAGQIDPDGLLYLDSLETVFLEYGECGGVLIFPAGNSSNNIDVYPEYMAASNLKNIISVANFNVNTGFLRETSNYGEVSVDIAAPGTEIYSTIGTNEYTCKSGTSMAAPMVTGTVALMRSVNPYIQPEEIKAILMQTATSLSSLQGKVGCGGYLNVERAVLGAKAAYRAEFNGVSYTDDTWGAMSLWENSSGLYQNGATSFAEVSPLMEEMLFETTTDSAVGATNVYQYNRLSSQQMTANVFNTSENGMTVDLSLKLDMTPIQSTVTESTPKFSQTGFVIDVHADESDREFYLCIAEYHGVSGKNVAVTSFYGNRNALNTSTTIYLNVPNFDTTVHRYTFAYNPQDNEILFYLDGEYQGQFWGPTLRQSPASDKDFVCFSLVNRELNSYAQGAYQRAESTAWMDFFRIYNTYMSAPAVSGLLWQTTPPAT